jgi:hypothetical protein
MNDFFSRFTLSDKFRDRLMRHLTFWILCWIFMGGVYGFIFSTRGEFGNFLLKPFSLDRFLKAVYKALPSSGSYTNQNHEHVASTNRFLYFRADRKMLKVMIDEINYKEEIPIRNLKMK